MPDKSTIHIREGSNNAAPIEKMVKKKRNSKQRSTAASSPETIPANNSNNSTVPVVGPVIATDSDGIQS